MKFHQSTSEFFCPRGEALVEGLKKTTHLGIAAHPDDLEIMAFHGIAECYEHQDQFFSGVLASTGMPRSGKGEEQTKKIRWDEQKQAASVGQYSAVVTLDYLTTALKTESRSALEEDLIQIFEKSQPEIVYTHNLADRHPTHVAVATSVIRALRTLPDDKKPDRVFGCEVWGDLDWVLPAEKIVLDVTGHDTLAQKVLGEFTTQLDSKRYVDAALGRRQAHATFLSSHVPDNAEQFIFALDCTPLVYDSSLHPSSWIEEKVNRFRDEVRKRIGQFEEGASQAK